MIGQLAKNSWRKCYADNLESGIDVAQELWAKTINVASWINVVPPLSFLFLYLTKVKKAKQEPKQIQKFKK